jgi:hypothetical protein
MAGSKQQGVNIKNVGRDVAMILESLALDGMVAPVDLSKGVDKLPNPPA